jgi:hypothetical protein
MQYPIKERCRYYDPNYGDCAYNEVPQRCTHTKEDRCWYMRNNGGIGLLSDEEIIKIYGWADANDILNP